jgi:methionyl-tRNA synthetase
MVKKKFYVTTAIDYPNAEPHIGHAYQKVIADVLFRWHTLLGEDSWFLTGTDEHGKKIEETAQKAGKKPKEFVDELSVKFKEAWSSLNIHPSRFIRTTDSDHEKLVQDAIRRCIKSGDIYKGNYEGLYCVGCEQYYTEKDLVEGKCPIHKKPVELIKEESYFFRLSKYQDFLLSLYENNSKFILPKERKNEIINRVKEGLKDLSISRTSFDWGIPFPEDKKHVVYVWFDALFNYITGSGKNHKYWPADVHLLGKDNSWFHNVYWPAFLKSAGYELPKTVFVHGFLTVNGEKISKSLGNIISPNYLVEKYGADTIRYFFCRNFVFGEDGDFSEKALVDRHNGELVNKLGNLISRVSGLIEKYGIKKCENSLREKLDLEKIKKLFENYEIDKVLNEIFAYVDVCNEYVQHKKPWESKDKEVLYELSDSIKIIAILLNPFIPSKSEKIAEQFGFEISLKNLDKPLSSKLKIKSGTHLFSRIEFEEKVIKEEKIEEIMDGVGVAEFSDWEKLDLQVAQIKDVEEIKGADKLWKLSLDCGELGKRTICAGIKQFYSKEELKGKKIIYFSNLKPRMLKGIESQGMLLAASNNEHSKVVLIAPIGEIENGSRVG